MQIIDLTDDHQPLYFCCLEDWSDEMKEAGPRKAEWFGKMKERGLRVKLAVDDGGTVGGMIHYLPIEHSFVDGEALYFIPCIWVHGHKQGRGDFRRRGMGKALLQAAEDDARSLGAKGVAAWGLALPFWMKASWFKKHGYAAADRDGIAVLLWKPFDDDAVPPRWFKSKKRPDLTAGKVCVTSLVNGWCPGQNLIYERAKRAAVELGDRVEFREIDTSDRAIAAEWGAADALYVDGRPVRTGPPPSYEKIKGIVAGRLRKLERASG